MRETLNHLKEEQGLTHNDTVLLTIFVAVRTYLKLPLPYRFITRIRKLEVSEFVGMEGWGRKDGRCTEIMEKMGELSATGRTVERHAV